jgi:hypothetical protein
MQGYIASDKMEVIPYENLVPLPCPRVTDTHKGLVEAYRYPQMLSWGLLMRRRRLLMGMLRRRGRRRMSGF